MAAHGFETVLRLLHPGMPFITEALFRRLPGRADASIVVAPWPAADAGRDDPDAERDFAFVQALVDAVRAIRADYEVKPGQPVDAVVTRATGAQRAAFATEREAIVRLARLGALTVEEGTGARAAVAGAHALLPDGADLFVALGGVIDVAKECARLGAELQRLDRQIAGLKTKLANPGFTGQAPAEVVERERTKEREWTVKREALASKLAALGCA